jgi:hypothetical protein
MLQQGPGLADRHKYLFTIAGPVGLEEPGISLFAAMKQRKTIREFDPLPLSLQQISNLLWTACGQLQTSE